MPASTTAVNACDVVIWMEDNGGNLVDVSGNSNNFSLDFNRDIGEFKPFGSKWRTRLDCGKDASLSLDLVFTTTLAEGLQMLQDWFFNGSGAREFNIDVPDSNPGSDRYEGDFVLESFNIPGDSSSADPIVCSASLKPDGQVTWSKIA